MGWSPNDEIKFIDGLRGSKIKSRAEMLETYIYFISRRRWNANIDVPRISAYAKQALKKERD